MSNIYVKDVSMLLNIVFESARIAVCELTVAMFWTFLGEFDQEEAYLHCSACCK